MIPPSQASPAQFRPQDLQIIPGAARRPGSSHSEISETLMVSPDFRVKDTCPSRVRVAPCSFVQRMTLTRTCLRQDDRPVRQGVGTDRIEDHGHSAPEKLIGPPADRE